MSAWQHRVTTSGQPTFQTTKEQEVRNFEKRFHEIDRWNYIVKDKRASAYKLAAQHGFQALEAFTIMHIEVMEQYNISFEKMREITLAGLSNFDKMFYRIDRWDRITSDKRKNAYDLVKEHGFKRIAALTLNIIETMEDYQLSLEQVESEGFSEILKQTDAKRRSLLSLLGKKKELTCKLATTLTAQQIDLLNENDLTISQIQDGRVITLYARVEKRVHKALFNQIINASEAVLQRIYNLSDFSLTGMLEYGLLLNEVEDQKFITFMKQLPKKEYLHPMLQLMKEQGVLQVTRLSRVQVEAKQTLGLTFAEASDVQLSIFAKELAESFHTWQEVLDKALFKKHDFQDIVTLNAKQIDAVIGLNFTVLQVRDAHFQNFYDVFENAWFKNLPYAIEQALRNYPYQRIFKLNQHRLNSLADQTASLEALEREIGIQDYGFTEQQVNDPSFHEACRRDLPQIAKWVSGKDFAYTKRIFLLEDDQFEAFKQGLELSIVENEEFRKFYATVNKKLRAETCALIKKEGQKIWQLSPLQFEARIQYQLSLEVVLDQNFEPLFKQHFAKASEFVNLIKAFGWPTVSKLTQQQFQAIFEHKLEFTQVTHPQFEKFYQNFLKTHAELGLQLVKNHGFEKTACLDPKQADGIKEFGLTLPQIEDPAFENVYAKEFSLKKIDFDLLKLGLTYLEIAQLADVRKVAILEPGMARLSKLERNRFLKMVTTGLPIDAIESEEFTRFCEKAQDEALRAFAFKLIVEEKKPYKRVFALTETQLQAMRDHQFPLERVEAAATVFAEAIKEWGEKAIKIIQDNPIKRTYKLEYRHFVGMLKYGLSIDDVGDIENGHFQKFYVRIQNEPLRLFAFKLIIQDKEPSDKIFALTETQLQARCFSKFSLEPKFAEFYSTLKKEWQDHAAPLALLHGTKRIFALDNRHFHAMVGLKLPFTLEEVEDPNFKRLYDNLIKPDPDTAIKLIQAHGYQKVVALNLEQLNAIKDKKLSLTFEQVFNSTAAQLKEMRQLKIMQQKNIPVEKLDRLDEFKTKLQQLIKTKSNLKEISECCEEILKIDLNDTETTRLWRKANKELDEQRHQKRINEEVGVQEPESAAAENPIQKANSSVTPNTIRHESVIQTKPIPATIKNPPPVTKPGSVNKVGVGAKVKSTSSTHSKTAGALNAKVAADTKTTSANTKAKPSRPASAAFRAKVSPDRPASATAHARVNYVPSAAKNNTPRPSSAKPIPKAIQRPVSAKIKVPTASRSKPTTATGSAITPMAALHAARQSQQQKTKIAKQKKSIVTTNVKK